VVVVALPIGWFCTVVGCGPSSGLGTLAERFSLDHSGSQIEKFIDFGSYSISDPQLLGFASKIPRKQAAADQDCRDSINDNTKRNGRNVAAQTAHSPRSRFQVQGPGFVANIAWATLREAIESVKQKGELTMN
jgi:hypothetical protein